jgi:RNA polymerase sigma-70 factor (ECF subfamily)
MASAEVSTVTALATISPSKREVLERLCAQHRVRVLQLALRYGGGDNAWAEDVAQDVLLRLCERIDDLDDTTDLGGWIYRVTTNSCLSRMRRERIWRSLLQLLPARWSPRTPEALVGAREQLRHSSSVLQAMPPKQRVVFCMAYLDELSQAEIARTLGHSEGYVSKLLKRARASIRAAGYEVDDVA